MGPLFHKVCILGVGLIGGSLAMACKRYGLADEVVGADEDHSVLEKAFHRGAIDCLTSNAKVAVEGAGLVVLAVPVGAMAAAARAMREAVPPGAIVTDVGSVKGELVGVLEELFSPRSPFVGGHPLAGAETSGLESASADLFAGSRCILTPTSRTDPRALDQVSSLWRGVGAEVVTLDPKEHDWAMAAVSHLPHVASYALAKAVSTVDRGRLFVGPGFRDFSRLASSPAALWSDICLNNRDSLLAMIGRYQEALETIRMLIAAGAGAALEREFQKAREVREQLIRS
ncbi:MAG: prephenate dehydrogenase/arogenate dehydrogenase family protein [Candidatus Tectomicrobia bacterium]|uniref:Prephenate dehydrogenase/arogenate dehydrogenase family protein n=1 Tax=Tectimicrobiota bacterium TaxID=2528274 RepID=A0A932GMG6_UNCTE|nr:prephenate dehydrogenase/arogenate dehydrogenase family protein [Candidatus Tectomicrobia bacterium]